MTLTDQCFNAAKPIWDEQLRHKFVQQLGDGSLAVERFRRWVLQDYLYLKEFARIFAWAVAKADQLDSMGWYAKVLDLTLNTEMALHRTYAERFGVSPEELEAQPMWPTTRA
jgi:thiaminase/transcriptional activator TenA